MSVTDEIKSRIDIVSYVQRHVPELKKAGRNYKACCPFHNEKTPSFVVNPERQTWHCFGACAEGGDLFTFAQKKHGWDFREALRELAAEAGLELRPQTPAQKSLNDRLERLRSILAAATEFYQRELQRPPAKAVLEYVRDGRGLTDETIENFQLGYAPSSWDFMLQSLRDLGYDDDDIVEVGLVVRNENGRVYDRFRNRLIIPIRDDSGRVLGFGGRALDPSDTAKYINSPQSALFDKSRLLYGLDRAKAAIRDSDTAVIAEGYLDVIQAHQAGFLNVVAQMGTSMTEPQIRLLAPRHAKKIVLALDSDQAGQNATRRSLDVARQTLSQDYAGKLSVDIRILQIPTGKDPDDYLRETPEGWSALVEEAQSIADFVIALETASLTADSSLQERQAVAQRVLPILLVSEDNLYQRENIQKLARRLRLGERELLAWVQALPSENTPRPALPPELPPEYWDNEHDLAPPDKVGSHNLPAGGESSAPTKIPFKRAIESYCLSLLLRKPDRLYQVNRKLRELAGNDEQLLQGPLQELSAEDFTHSQYRVLMAQLLDSIAQDDLDPHDYLANALDGEFEATYKALLNTEPGAVDQTIRGNFEVDLHDITRKRQDKISRRGFSSQDEQDRLYDELINSALQLRLARLENERVEMQYLQEEAQSATDSDPMHQSSLNSKILLSMQAKLRINLAASQNSQTLPQASIS